MSTALTGKLFHRTILIQHKCFLAPYFCYAIALCFHLVRPIFCRAMPTMAIVHRQAIPFPYSNGIVCKQASALYRCCCESIKWLWVVFSCLV